MNYSDFVTQYRKGSLKVRVDNNAAGYMYEDPYLMPKNLRIKQSAIRFIAFGGTIGSVILFFFMPWWAAIILLIISLSMFRVAQNQAAQDVMKAALMDNRVYQIAIDKNVLFIEK